MTASRISNVLTDREAAAFVGVKYAHSIVSAFISFPQPAQLSVKGLDPKSERFWPVKDLCKVYEIDKFTAMTRLNKLITLGHISGPILISRK